MVESSKISDARTMALTYMNSLDSKGKIRGDGIPPANINISGSRKYLYSDFKGDSNLALVSSDK